MIISRPVFAAVGNQDGLEPWREIYRLATRTLARIDGKSDAYESIMEAIALAHTGWVADSLSRFVTDNCERLSLTLRTSILELVAQIRRGDIFALKSKVARIESYHLSLGI